MSALEQRFLDLWREFAPAGFPDPVRQHVIDGKAFDFSWPDYKVTVETQGIGFGHTTIKSKTADAEKINSATILGWRVLTFTSSMLASKEKGRSAIHHVLFLLGEKDHG